MGQDQSTLLNDENIDEAEARVRPRNKKVTTRQVKTVVSYHPGSRGTRIAVAHNSPSCRSLPVL